MFFTGIRDISIAFSEPPKLADPKLMHAANFVETETTGSGGLGFFSSNAKYGPLETAQRILAEHGTNLEPNQLLKVVSHLGDIEKMHQLKRRFWVQIGLTIVVCALIYALLGGIFGEAEAFSKAAFGLIGTVIGYWLK